MLKGEWTISNLLSFSRILLLVPISILLLQNDPSERWIVLLLIIIAAFTDFFDGILARRLNQVTELGKIIDPIADKICIATVGLVLLLQHKIPPWFFMMIFFRDITILLGGLYLRKKKSITLPSNNAGKLAAAAMTAYLIFAYIEMDSLEILTQAFLALSTLLLIISFVLYFRRFVKYTGI